MLAPLLVTAGIFHKGSGGLFGLPDLATFSFATFGGLFLGALIFSVMADRFGRRPIFTYSLLWYALATLVMSGMSTALTVCLWRFIASIGVGAEIIAVDSYLAEMMPKRIRGRGFAISKGLQYAAIPLAGAFAAALARRRILGLDGWHYLLFVPLLGAVSIWFVRRSLPESPRWLAEHGKIEEASAILDRVESRIVQQTGRVLPEPQPPILIPEVESTGLDLFRGALLQRTLLLIVASCSSAVAFLGFANWLPTILEAQGQTVTKSLLNTTLIAISYPLAPFCFSYFADRFERKWQVVTGAGVVVISGLLFARQSSTAGWIVFGFTLTLGNILASYAIHTYRSEVFPTSVRARAIGVVFSFDPMTAGFSGYIIGFILIRAGATGVLVFISGASLLNMLVIGIFGPKTRGLASEEVTNRFGASLPIQGDL